MRLNSPRRAGAGLALLVGTSLLGLRAYEGLRSTADAVAPASIRAASEVQRQFVCLETAFRSVVPPGSKVFLAIPDSLWYQRTAAAAFPDRILVGSADRADVVVSVRSSRPAPCEGDVFDSSPGQR